MMLFSFSTTKMVRHVAQQRSLSYLTHRYNRAKSSHETRISSISGNTHAQLLPMTRLQKRTFLSTFDGQRNGLGAYNHRPATRVFSAHPQDHIATRREQLFESMQQQKQLGT